MSNEIAVAVISGIMSGIGVALANYLINRKKVEVEIQKMKAETDKIYAEIKNLSATVSYGLEDSFEQILFDGTHKIDGFDIKGSEGQHWKDDKPITGKGNGVLKFEDFGVINLKRTNTDGRFELWVMKYIYNGNEYDKIPNDDLISGKRKILVSCEAKAIGGEHTLRFVVRDAEKTSWLTSDTVRVIGNDWTQYQIYLQFDPSKNSILRIDDENVSVAPSSVQIRNLVITERKPSQIKVR